jgi:hypothetical protein
MFHSSNLVDREKVGTLRDGSLLFPAKLGTPSLMELVASRIDIPKVEMPHRCASYHQGLDCLQQVLQESGEAYAYLLLSAWCH